MSHFCYFSFIQKEQRKSKIGFLSLLPAPTRRTLENVDITTLEKLSKHSGKDILKLHEIRKTTIPKLREALEAENLIFTKLNT
ncbi:hypothetical protein DOS84_17845 [Flavobacterium aquariorum]|uniref:RNA polymerase alpha subunit C-terminal domain-containing protein n=1 Tax=Flavobacterium aquariorum TaxID=2217670 RepID=A0A2W7TTC4_9FLAO|nr:hypothetical protein DOS84_17845 [Flavobacterium aquariorum]